MDEQGEDHTGGSAAAVCAVAAAAVCPVIREGEGRVVMILEFAVIVASLACAFALGYIACRTQCEEEQRIERQRVLEREEIVNELFKKLNEGK